MTTRSQSTAEPGVAAPRSSSSNWQSWASPIAVGVATFLVLLLSEPRLAIVWDEGFTLGRQQRVRLWFKAMLAPAAQAAAWHPQLDRELVPPDGVKPPAANEIDTRWKLLQPRVIEWFWPFAREE